MSRRAAQSVVTTQLSTPAPTTTTMGPPPDRDVVMGPPPVPPQMTTVNLSQPPKPADQDVVVKYSSLKRKYFDLEEKYKEATAELQRSGERNVRLRQERNILLDRIIELEGPSPSPSQPHPSLQLPSAFPRALVSQGARNYFAATLRTAIHEIEHEDPSIDPLFTSRHVGPQGRKRDEERERRIRDAIAREAQRTPADEVGRKGVKRARGAGSTGKAREGEGATPPVLVSSGGTRLRLKPPVNPHDRSMPPPGGPFQQQPPPPMMSSHGHARQHSNPDLRHEQYTYPPPGSPHDEREMHHHSPASGSFRPNSPPGYFHHPAQQPPPHIANGHGHGHVQSPPLTIASPRTDRASKPKRLKAHTVSSKVYNIPTIPRDKKSKPILPLNVGIMTVLSLGEVCMREHFHTERYIFPVGYAVQRRYLSMMSPDEEVVYKCSILDGGDGPKFQIIPSDNAHHPIMSGTATGAWAVVVKQANQIRNRQHSNSVSGPDFFGLGQNTIKHLIQELPGADMLRDYVWQHFVEGGPLGGRHAAVIPALPDDHGSAQPGYLPQGQYLTPEQEREIYLRETQRDPREREREREVYEGEDDMVPSQAPSQLQSQQPSSSLGLTRPQPQLNARRDYAEDGHRQSPSSRERSSSRRRSSRGDDHISNGHANLRPQSPLRGPGSHRASHSPVLHREREREREQYVLPPPHSPSSSHSGYRGQSNGNGNGNGSFHAMSTSPPPPPPVPAGLASIMNAYPGPRPSRSPGSDSDYHRRGGSGSSGHP